MEEMEELEPKARKAPKTLAQGRKPGSGRKSKLTEETKKIIINMIATGVPATVACAAAGVTDAALYVWMKKAKEQPNSIYGELAEEMPQARARGIATRVRRINEAGNNGVWQADAWFLERTDPENFARKNTNGEGSTAPRITVNTVLDLSALQGLTDDRIAIINANLQRAIQQTSTIYRIEGGSDGGRNEAGPIDLDDYQ